MVIEGLIAVHNPFPTVGERAVKIVEFPQIVWSIPAFEGDGCSITVTKTVSDCVMLFCVTLNTNVFKPNDKLLTWVVELVGVSIVPNPSI